MNTSKQPEQRRSEARRGQTAITAEDISRITDIVSNYDAIASEPIKGTNNRCFAFAKQFDDGLIVYLADSSKKRRDLRTVSMWKYPQSANAQDVLQHAVSLSNLRPKRKGAYPTTQILPPTPTPIKTYCFKAAQTVECSAVSIT